MEQTKKKIEPSMELAEFITETVISQQLKGITSIPCGYGRLEQMIAEKNSQLKIIGIDNKCLSEFDGTTRKYKHIVVDWDEKRKEDNPESFKWVDKTITFHEDALYLPVPKENALLFCNSVDNVPWSLYVENYIDNDGKLIFVIESDDKSSPNVDEMMKKLEDYDTRRWYLQIINVSNYAIKVAVFSRQLT